MLGVTKKATPRKKFVARYFFAFISLLLLTGSGMLILQSQGSIQEEISEFVNTSGRQRMLSQRLCLILEEAIDQSEPNKRLIYLSEAREALDVFAKSHADLIKGKLSGDRQGRLPETVRVLYFTGDPSADALSRSFIEQAQDLMEKLRNVSLTNLNVNQISDFTDFTKGPLLDSLTKVTFAFQSESTTVNQVLRTDEFIIFALLLLLFVLETLLVFTPITRSLSQALQASKLDSDWFRTVFEKSPVGMCLVTLDMRWTKVNIAATQLLGYSAEEFYKMTINDTTHPEDRVTTSEKFEELSNETIEALVYEKRYVHKAGHTVWMSVAASLLPATHDRPKMLLATLKDITERRIANEELHKAQTEALSANRLKSEFLANMSHELRTPLNGVIGMADLLAESKLEPEQRKFIEIIQNSSQGLLELISNILDISKIDADNVEIEPADFSVEDVVQHQANLFYPELQRKNLSFSTVIDPAIPKFVSGDARKLSQVLMNLVGNAVKFTDRGAVTVKVEARGRDLYFSIEDSGPGIPESAQAHLFKSFTQMDGSSVRKFGGAGLGLSICKRFVEFMGGEIGVESQEGRGAKFWFTCPMQVALAEPDRATVGAESAPSPKVVDAAARRILVVEDNRVNQLLAISLVNRLGYQAEAANNGVEALTALENGHFDLILMDCQMPEMDGLEATRRIRQKETAGGVRIPIVALTANAMKEDAENCFRSGMDAYLAKPVKKAQLSKVIAHWLSVGEPKARAS